MFPLIWGVTSWINPFSQQMPLGWPQDYWEKKSSLTPEGGPLPQDFPEASLGISPQTCFPPVEQARACQASFSLERSLKNGDCLLSCFPPSLALLLPFLLPSPTFPSHFLSCSPPHPLLASFFSFFLKQSNNNNHKRPSQTEGWSRRIVGSEPPWTKTQQVLISKTKQSWGLSLRSGFTTPISTCLGMSFNISRPPILSCKMFEVSFSFPFNVRSKLMLDANTSRWDLSRQSQSPHSVKAHLSHFSIFLGQKNHSAALDFQHGEKVLRHWVWAPHCVFALARNHLQSLTWLLGKVTL